MHKISWDRWVVFGLLIGIMGLVFKQTSSLRSDLYGIENRLGERLARIEGAFQERSNWLGAAQFITAGETPDAPTEKKEYVNAEE